MLTPFDSIKEYMNLLYTIRELGLGDIYSTFISEFVVSNVYKFYVKECGLIEKTTRWCDTLSKYKEL